MVNFTFVTHKGARPEKSELVKAHVMRESQRKRREARKKAHSMLSMSIVLFQQEAYLLEANIKNLRRTI